MWIIGETVIHNETETVFRIAHVNHKCIRTKCECTSDIRQQQTIITDESPLFRQVSQSNADSRITPDYRLSLTTSLWLQHSLNVLINIWWHKINSLVPPLNVNEVTFGYFRKRNCFVTNIVQFTCRWLLLQSYVQNYTRIVHLGIMHCLSFHHW